MLSSCRPLLIISKPFKSVLRRHPRHPDGLPFYNELSKAWIIREGERWWHLDAAGEQLPRIAEVAAFYITGQHRPDFHPKLIMGDNVVITNIRDVVMVGDDWVRVPVTWRTNFPGGKYRVRLSDIYERDPCMLVWLYIRREVNHHFGKTIKARSAPLEKVWLYEDAIHPHQDKNPRPLHWTDPKYSHAKWVSPSHQRRWTVHQFLQ